MRLSTSKSEDMVLMVSNGPVEVCPYPHPVVVSFGQWLQERHHGYIRRKWSFSMDSLSRLIGWDVGPSRRGTEESCSSTSKVASWGGRALSSTASPIFTGVKILLLDWSHIFKVFLGFLKKLSILSYPKQLPTFNILHSYNRQLKKKFKKNPVDVFDFMSHIWSTSFHVLGNDRKNERNKSTRWDQSTQLTGNLIAELQFAIDWCVWLQMHLRASTVSHSGLLIRLNHWTKRDRHSSSQFTCLLNHQAFHVRVKWKEEN